MTTVSLPFSQAGINEVAHPGKAILPLRECLGMLESTLRDHPMAKNKWHRAGMISFRRMGTQIGAMYRPEKRGEPFLSNLDQNFHLTASGQEVHEVEILRVQPSGATICVTVSESREAKPEQLNVQMTWTGTRGWKLWRSPRKTTASLSKVTKETVLQKLRTLLVMPSDMSVSVDQLKKALENTPAT